MCVGGIDIGGVCEYGKILYFPLSVVVSLKQHYKHEALLKKAQGALCTLPAEVLGVSMLSNTQNSEGLLSLSLPWGQSQIMNTHKAPDVSKSCP